MKLRHLQENNFKHTYITEMRPVFNKKALFCDMNEEYLFPSQPEAYTEVKIRFRTEKNNVDCIYCICDGNRILMTLSSFDELFDYYEIKLQLENKKVIYFFEIQAGKIVCFYDRRGPVKDTHEQYAFAVIPGFQTPNWAKGAVMYQIYVDRFCNGDPTNDVLTDEYSYLGGHTVKVDDWNKYPALMGVREFYGGDLQGVLDKLDYLQDLGIDVIYFNPLFVSPSNHKYDIQDYDYIDPHLTKIVSEEGELLDPGQMENRFASKYKNRVTNINNLESSNQFFVKVVEEIHKRGIKVIIDGVFNHCGSFHKWLDKERIYENAPGYKKGAYVDSNSPFHNYFAFYQENDWPYNNSYDGWWGHDTLPKLNYEGSYDLYQYILKIAAKWVSPPYNVDGWRLDVAADLAHSPEMNHKFWKDFRKVVKQANPNAIILAEHYGDPSSWLQGDQWDTVMNYDAFMEPITWFLTGMQKHSDDYREDLIGNAASFWDAMYYHSTNFTMPSLFTSMNELSNHDHSRFLTRTNKKVGRVNTLGSEAANSGVNKAVMREAVLIQMTWPGAPTIYYGDEAGVCGFTDPDNRRTYPWGNEDRELISYHKDLIRIHKENQEFLTGSIKELVSDYNVIAYGRFNKKTQSIILVNNNENEYNAMLEVWTIGVPKNCMVTQLIMSTENGYTIESKEYQVVSGRISLILPKTSAVILQYKRNN